MKMIPNEEPERLPEELYEDVEEMDTSPEVPDPLDETYILNGLKDIQKYFKEQ